MADKQKKASEDWLAVCKHSQYLARDIINKSLCLASILPNQLNHLRRKVVDLLDHKGKEWERRRLVHFFVLLLLLLYRIVL